MNKDPKVTEVECFFLRYPIPESIRYEYSGGVVENMDIAIIRVTCDTGEYGLGEVTFGQFCSYPVQGLVQHFRNLLIGLSVHNINKAWSLMYGSSIFWNRQGLGIGVMGGINIAMYDLLGKYLDLPVYQLLGGAVRETVGIYASNGLFNDPESLIKDVKRARSMGFNSYKMRVVHPETIISQVAAFRKEFGYKMDLIVDAVQGSCATPWSIAISKQMAKELESFKIVWFEEPCRVENIQGYQEIRRSTSLNIAGAESIPTARAFQPYIEKGAFSVVQFDIGTSGFSESMKIANLADVYNYPVAIHSWGSIISILSGIHLALSLTNCVKTEYCFMDHPFNELLSIENLKIEQGYVSKPRFPGLGVTFDESLLKRFPYPDSDQPNTMISVEDKEIQIVSYKL